MEQEAIRELAIIAGKGVYPVQLAESARQQGVRRIVAVAFRGETRRDLARRVDEIRWLYIGQLAALVEALRATGVRHAVMAGQITPTHLFNVRPDRAMFDLLRRLPVRNAETIFGAVGETLRGIGVELLPAHQFMAAAMPAPGVLTRRAPTEQEQADIRLGLRVADATSGLDIGQTVVIKDGVVLAVEAFEGTDEAIRRAGRLAGPGAVVVKIAKQRHDMRFDIPVVGQRTIKTMRRARAGVLALEAGRTILLDKEAVVAVADRRGICLVAVAREAQGNHGTSGR